MKRLLAVYDGADNLLMRFEYADDRMPAAVNAEGVTYYLAYDQVGSLRVVADSAGNVVKRTDYDSFGNIINDTNPAFEVPFGFAGGLHDRDTGLVRFGYRDYDPDVGRWTAKDPIGFAGGDTDLYGYVLSDPVNKIDPVGLFDPIPGLNAHSKLERARDHFQKANEAKQRQWDILTEKLKGKNYSEEETNKMLREAAEECSSERQNGVNSAIEGVIETGEAIYFSPKRKMIPLKFPK